MIFRKSPSALNEAYCDDGPYAGMWRVSGVVYGSRDEIDLLLGHRKTQISLVVPPAASNSPDGGYTSGSMRNDSPSTPPDLRFVGALIEAELSAVEIPALSITAAYASETTIVVAVIVPDADAVRRALAAFDPLPPGASRVEHHISDVDQEFVVRVYFPRGDL